MAELAQGLGDTVLHVLPTVIEDGGSDDARTTSDVHAKRKATVSSQRVDHSFVREHAFAFAQAQLALISRADAAAPFRDVVESVLAVAQALNRADADADADIFNAEAELQAFDDAASASASASARVSGLEESAASSSSLLLGEGVGGRIEDADMDDVAAVSSSAASSLSSLSAISAPTAAVSFDSTLSGFRIPSLPSSADVPRVIIAVDDHPKIVPEKKNKNEQSNKRSKSEATGKKSKKDKKKSKLEKSSKKSKKSSKKRRRVSSSSSSSSSSSDSASS